jgi:dimethylaniline monooxygenase (N-oxide forming)
MQSVAIIGGGVSGLICIKCCLDDGLSPICYEMTNDIGGLWNYDLNAVEGKASVMKSTVINTSKEFMAFSDYPPPAEYPNYMHNTKLLDYFRMYATKFNLIEYIRFRRRVTRIQPANDYEQTGCWMIYSVDAEQRDEGTIRDEIGEKYDAVMLATGHHAHPRWADFPGLEHFKGQKLHSWQYKTPHGFEDKTVLVIGIGNSGGDMVVELGRFAKQVLIMRSSSCFILI